MITTIIIRRGYPVWHGSLARAKKHVKKGDVMILIYMQNKKLISEFERAETIFNI